LSLNEKFEEENASQRKRVSTHFRKTVTPLSQDAVFKMNAVIV
jgi:hypothetical protein